MPSRLPPVAPPTANQITTELLLRVSREMSNVWMWRNNRFVGEAVGAGGKTRYVSAGIDGQGDLSGVVSIEVATAAGERRRMAIRIEIEIKAEYARGRDRQSPVQQAFARRLTGLGGVYLLVERIGWGADGKPDVSAAMEQLKKVAE